MPTKAACGHVSPLALPVAQQEPAGQQTLGYIHSVETCGTVDGPGLRYVLFLGGCPLRCVYCHNPDARGKPHGKTMTAREALEDILRYRSFILRGGLTISGGEPLLQADFVTAVFAGAKRAGLHTALDTSGFRGDAVCQSLLEHTDLVLLDIKSWDRATYKRVTGVEIDSTLAFAKRLERLGIAVWIRFVLVPGLTDEQANVEGLSQFVATLTNVQRVQVLPFHKLGEHKYTELGVDFELTDTPTPSPSEIGRVREIFARRGLNVS
jgi:pyruvate formate lyase activating enzyme